MAFAFNQYSLLLTAIGILTVAAFLLFRKGLRHQEVIAFLVIFAGLFVAWLALRPIQSPLSSAANEVQSRIGAGKPVLLEFQSPY